MWPPRSCAVAVEEGGDQAGVAIPGNNYERGGGLLPVHVECVHQAAPFVFRFIHQSTCHNLDLPVPGGQVDLPDPLVLSDHQGGQVLYQLLHGQLTQN